MSFVLFIITYPQYDKFVVNLATNLMQKYDVVFDKWEIRHGNNMDSFMENSIRKAEKVFIICEKTYVSKANNRVSGVGVETSIISSKVYRDTSQEKFIPVFLEGISVKPDYMESIFGIEVNPHIELSREKLEEFFTAVEGKSILEKPKFDNQVIITKIDIPDKVENVSIDEKVKKGIFDVGVPPTFPTKPTLRT